MSASSCKAIRVVIADPQMIFAQSLGHTLAMESDIEVCGVYTRIQMLLNALRGERSITLLLDPVAFGTPHMELVEHVRSRCPMAAIIVLSGQQHEDQFFAAIRAGARAYLAKSAELVDVRRAIRDVSAGRTVLCPAWVRGRLDEYNRRSQVETGLTGRERDVLSGIIRGDSYQEIGRSLALSEKTVKNYASEIFSKLDVHNRTEAAVYALRHSLVTEGDWRLSMGCQEAAT